MNARNLGIVFAPCLFPCDFGQLQQKAAGDLRLVQQMLKEALDKRVHFIQWLIEAPDPWRGGCAVSPPNGTTGAAKSGGDNEKNE